MQCRIRVRVREPTSKFSGFRQSYGRVLLAKIVVLYPFLNPKTLNAKRITIKTNSNTLNTNQARN